MTVSLPLLLVEQAQAHLQVQVLLLLAEAVAAAELLQALLVGQGVQVVVGVRLLLVTVVLLRRQVKVTPVDRIAPMEEVEAVLERLETLMGKVKVGTDYSRQYQELHLHHTIRAVAVVAHLLLQKVVD
jgi:hypothetical protein